MDSKNDQDVTLLNNRANLIESELEALFQVGKVLSRSLNLDETLEEVLKHLHHYAGMHYGVVTLRTDDGELSVNAVYAGDKQQPPKFRYRIGEGIIGSVMQLNKTIVVERAGDDPRFLDRLGLYERHLPFIGIPIHINQELVGVLAAQPCKNDRFLHERTRFMEMVAQLIAQSVRFSNEIAKERRDLTDERDRLRQTVRGQYSFDNIVGHSPTMQRVFEMVRQVAKWNTTVLIRGESGTGKELIANAIHYNSPRHTAAFIKVNCAALPENLLESELFGHEKGAFSGAINQHKGRFERADGGTLFLDEIGEISPTFQAKLLRVLQEGELERIGGTRTIKVDVRVIAATNVNLEDAVENNEFREDLYYRLNVMPIRLPPLRERIEDIPELAHFLITKIAKMQARKLELTDSAIRLLIRHDWPGNVRELENCLERAAIMCEGELIDRSIISMTGLEEKLTMPTTNNDSNNNALTKVDLNDESIDERERVIAALEQAGWVQAKAARLLNMTPRQIAYRIQTLNIKLRNI
ncbi:Nif-specific regulatory protein [Beggiatoa alba B18LD]|uniref:Nif-specific regulatory protein n=1 Tax=Beggiatoa alba B18LD TaxID=395493 RepID=I3CCA6_9GAMM|nr:nif-specific transcriptional activator NifA [Beggiatoa alba]EIJ41249.1 Nif-specific regulatory protein [Beggiatoa alba B18LD]